MFMKDDKNKKSATVIISRLRKDQPEEMKEAPMEDGAYQDVNELEVAAEEIMSAIESKDAKALKESLKSFMSMCEDSEEES